MILYQTLVSFLLLISPFVILFSILKKKEEKIVSLKNLVFILRNVIKEN